MPAQDLINTWFGRIDGGGEEHLATPADLAAWCRAHGSAVEDADVTGPQLALAHTVREGVRAWLAPHNDAVRPEDARALERLAAVIPELTLQVAVTEPPGLAPVPQGVRGALATVLAGPVLVGPKVWARLKVCRDPRCRTAFHDYSRNGSGVWCSMAACGAVNKQEAFVRRRRAQTQARKRSSAAEIWSGPPAQEDRT